MIKGFVFGKFLPFHKGHEAMIRFALLHCDFLTVLVCSSDKEQIHGSVREQWIKNTFKNDPNVQVKVFEYSEDELANTSIASEAISESWAVAFSKLLPGYSLLITSESYGDMVAGFMNIRHIAFDQDRKKYPISATAIRQDLFANWNFLPESVKPHFTIKVVVLGTESTGKTTLTTLLSKYYRCSAVLETAREIIPNSNTFCFEDLLPVAIEHARRIKLAMIAESPLIIIDTDIHTTLSYAGFAFDSELFVSNELYNSTKADLYLYLGNDAEYIQDGTRLKKQDRDLLDLSHRKVLEAYHISFVEINGNWNRRLNEAIRCIDKLIHEQVFR